MAVLAALGGSDYFDVVVVATRRDLFVTMCRAVYPEMVIVDEATAGGDASALARGIAHDRRIVPMVVWSARGRQIEPDEATLPLRALFGSTREARDQVQTALFSAATPIMTAKRTLLTDELADNADRMRDLLSLGGSMRREVVAMASWPLDLILLVDDGTSLNRLAATFMSIPALAVPVLLVLDAEDSDDYGAMKRAAPALVRSLRAPTNVRKMAGLYVVPADRSVELHGEAVSVAPGRTNVERLCASMGRLKSGGLSVMLSSSRPEHASTLAHVAAEGGLLAVLDPSACEHPHASAALMQSSVPPLIVAPDELRWVLQFARPRKA